MNIDTLLLAVIEALSRAKDGSIIDAYRALSVVRGLVDSASRSIREQAESRMG